MRGAEGAGASGGAGDSGGAGASGGAGLSDMERAVLEFESGWWRDASAKEEDIRTTFGWTVTRYYQRLNKLLDSQVALAEFPTLVGRLRRLREQRELQRRGLA